VRQRRSKKDLNNLDKAIEIAADTLGEMLLEVAEGRGDHSNEDIAAAVLKRGLAVLLDEAPGRDRLEEVRRALYAKLHNGTQPAWSAMTEAEKGFWLDLAAARYAIYSPLQLTRATRAMRSPV
jgi:hypothetical protein